MSAVLVYTFSLRKINFSKEKGKEKQCTHKIPECALLPEGVPGISSAVRSFSFSMAFPNEKHIKGMEKVNDRTALGIAVPKMNIAPDIKSVYTLDPHNPIYRTGESNDKYCRKSYRFVV